MAPSGQPARILFIAAALVAAACASAPEAAPDPHYVALTEASTSQPADDLERAVLTRLEKLEPGSEVAIGGARVTAGEAYFAASGRTCREVYIRGKGPERARLACLVDAAWAFVPDVLGPMAGGQSP